MISVMVMLSVGMVFILAIKKCSESFYSNHRPFQLLLIFFFPFYRFSLVFILKVSGPLR